MRGKTTRASPERQAEILAEIKRDRDLRQKSYRDQALKLLPHVCARCGRELSGKRLRELTVHHIDHNFKNNPPDGSNWELLCLYCHDHEHEKFRMAGFEAGATDADLEPLPSIFTPFEGLGNFVPPAPEGGDSEPPKEP